ncbi:hypothetical protein IX317_001278 [Fusobacterium sp. DD29]|uniref:flavodoxin family protein n=1 Tax=unclassified Fusobacterium TaxID=2648384 RepID=UPI001B8D8640|nr:MULTISPECIES: flavodoxin family protein [unclassified Fusobacterium]MBR8701818.1 hypothetical protein [Fusobacterium sp. DD45]MBR8711608.1 hypothetical protein [Fusobacterium sp. DD28]MBR8749604.1 hypothetical protein [Fusobacterium sp. DD29]MBR8752157.1 hypothetical protein [Fusobacterium sp. DD26]MBR8761865.1 hypothetical protein [Fusobacterium sp. DD25]
MKVLILNGSPRNGNTRMALNTLAEGIKENLECELELFNVAEYKVAPCSGCDYCTNNRPKCVINDDGEVFAQKIVDADVIIFGSPVYWWGITTQLKAVLDRMYMQGFDKLKGDKKIGIITIGGAELDDDEYDIISRQFRCIADFLDWKVVINESISAYKKDDLANNKEKLEYIKNLWKELK